MNNLLPCYCGSQKTYSECCQPFHCGEKKPPTAEQLMRSRYAAFCTKNADYLISTHHSSKRSGNDKAELERNFASIQWLDLKIIACQQGLETDDQGVVEFDARFRQNGVEGHLHEASRFVREQGSWYYLDGEFTPPASAPKLGRNDPCFCGSGKKFKKCHGA